MLSLIQKFPAGYKQTEIGVIPEDWDVKRLGDIGDSIIGLTYSPNEVASYGKLVHRSSNIQNNQLSYYDNVYVNKSINKKLILKENDILICVRNGSRDLIGKSALIKGKSVGETFGAFMSVFRSDKFQPFIFYLILSNLIQRQINQSLGATINQITNKTLNNFQIPYPPKLGEQTAIAVVLSDTDTLIEHLEKLIAKKKDIKQGAMQQLFTGKKRLPGFSREWKVKKLGEVGETYGGLSGKKKSDFDGGKYPYIPFMNIMSNPVIDLQYFDYVNIQGNEKQNRAIKGDLFFNGSSETPEEVGMCSVLQGDIPNLYLNSFCFGFRLNKDLKTDGLYLSYFFRSPMGRQSIFSLAQGATRYNLSKINFMKLEIPYPDPAEQITIAKIFSDMDAEIESLEQKRDKYTMLKQGMMQQLLTGRIRIYANN